MRRFSFYTLDISCLFLPSPASEYSFLFDWWDEVALIESVLVFAEKVRLYVDEYTVSYPMNHLQHTWEVPCPGKLK